VPVCSRNPPAYRRVTARVGYRSAAAVRLGLPVLMGLVEMVLAESPARRLPAQTALPRCRRNDQECYFARVGVNQLGGRFSMKAATPSSALGSIMLQAIVAPASS
jgi:hypothetical protein